MTPYSFDDIARYAENEMSPAEREAFEQALAADETLRQQLAFYKDVHSSLQQHFTKNEGQKNLEETLQQLRGEYFAKQNKPAKVIAINRYLRYAMGAAAVLLVTIFLWRPWVSLYDQYKEITMVDPTVRGDNADSLLREAAVLFNDEQFDEAAVLLGQVRGQRPDDSFTAFYYALALLHTDKDKESLEIFTNLYQSETIYKYEAAFYAALYYVKGRKSFVQARAWLQRIPPDAPNYNRAQALLRKL